MIGTSRIIFTGVDSNDRFVAAIGIVDIGYAGNKIIGIRHHRTACITGISLFGMGCGVVFIVGERLRCVVIGTSRIIFTGVDSNDRFVAAIGIFDIGYCVAIGVSSRTIFTGVDSDGRSVVAIGIVDIGYAGAKIIGIHHHTTISTVIEDFFRSNERIKIIPIFTPEEQ